MRLKRFAIATATSIGLSVGALAAIGGTPLQNGPLHAQAPPMGGIHWARGQQPKARSTSSPNLLYHGGDVMHGTFVQPIYWGPRWADSSFVADKVSGLAGFYQGMSGSNYANTTTEYRDASGAVSSNITYGLPLTDLSTAPNNGNNTSPILGEVCSLVGNGAAADGYYPVYVDRPRGHSRFCAWHSAGTCPNGATVQFAFFYNVDGDAGCDPQDGSGLHSQGLAALANVSGHELSETLTDRHLDAWYDSNGQENADKCAWTFGTPLLTFSNRTQWKVQGNWSNAAFNAGTGYPNSSGRTGCIDGGNYK